VWNDELRWTIRLPQLLAIAWLFSLCGHIAQMLDERDAKKILTASPLENWRRPSGCPHTTCTIQQDLNEAINVAQNRPVWTLMSTFGVARGTNE